MLSLEDMKNWYERLHKDKDYNLSNDLFIITLDEEPIGVGGLVRIDWRNRKGEVSFYVAETKGERFIRTALSKIVDYALQTLNLRKVYFPVYSFNPNLSTYEKVLKREYTAREEYYWEGAYWDRIILVKYNGKEISNKHSI